MRAVTCHPTYYSGPHATQESTSPGYVIYYFISCDFVFTGTSAFIQAYIEAGGIISRTDAIALASTNTEKLLGVDPETARLGDLVATEGGDMLDIQSKVVGVISPRRGQVELF